MDMKKFSLKPLGDSCMKMLCKSCFFIGLLMTFCLTACSDDDDDTVTPIFPENKILSVMQVRKKSSLSRLILTGVWHHQQFGVSFRTTIRKSL